RAQADRVGRVAVGDPLPAVALVVHHAGLGQHLQVRRRLDRDEAFAVLERQLEGGAADVVEQDQRLVRGDARVLGRGIGEEAWVDRKSTRLNSSHVKISYAVFCLKK